MIIGNEGRTSPSAWLSTVTDTCRRRGLRLLQTAGEPLSPVDLAIELIRLETDHETIGAEYEWVAEMELILHHIHVPTLGEVGLVEHDTG